MVVSEDENACNKIRDLLPQPIKIEFASSMRTVAEASARHRFRTIIVDDSFEGGAANFANHS